MNKTIAKTIISSIAVAVLSICMCIAVSAANMADIAKEIAAGTEVKCSFFGISSSANYFKIDCVKGDLTINYKADQRLTAVSLYDANGNEIAYKKADATVGKVRNLSFERITVTKKTYVYWAPKLKSAEGKITYDIQIGGLGSSYSGSFTFSIDAAAGSIAETLSIEPVITMEVGDSIGLGAVLTPNNAEKFTYSYKNNGVISITSNGKVTAKAAGKSYVIIKSGSLKLKVYITVID